MNVSCGATTQLSFAVWSVNGRRTPSDGAVRRVPPVWLTLIAVSASRGAVWSISSVEVRVDADGAVRAPDADAEPVGDVVVEPRAEEDRPPVLVEQRERDRRRELEAALAVEAQVPHRGGALERTRELELLRAGRARCRQRAQPPRRSPEPP